MKNISTLFVFLSTSFLLFSQNCNLLIFNNSGESFFVVLNGIQQNSIPKTNVRIEGLRPTNYEVKIIFADGKTADINKKLYFEPNFEYTTRITLKNGKKGNLRIFDILDLNTNSSQLGTDFVSYRPSENIDYSDTKKIHEHTHTEHTKLNSTHSHSTHSHENMNHHTVNTNANQSTGNNSMNVSVNGNQGDENMNIGIHVDEKGGSINLGIVTNGTQNLGFNSYFVYDDEGNQFSMQMNLTGLGNDMYVDENGNYYHFDSTNSMYHYSQTYQNNEYHNDNHNAVINTNTTIHTNNHSHTTGTHTHANGEVHHNHHHDHHDFKEPISSVNTNSHNKTCNSTLQNEQNLIKLIKNESFSSTQMKIVETDLNKKCLYADQAIKIISEFTFEGDKLKLAKFCFDRLIDKDNASQLLELFTFSSSKDEYLKYTTKN
jgi:uncharacterized membrane-anchored protein